jgi:3'-phosphoadenosine 5'-phosphosulfate sulfotransferase (PAPS reductase)/FAD synthetase
MADPFLITGPAVISFSGGRTSGYMLHRIIQAHGGTLPDDVVVCFANTGREMPATLDFVHRCGEQFRIPIRWLEYRHVNGKNTFEEVSHNSASRNGEPFAMLCSAKTILPNPVARFCTVEMKIRTIKRFIVSEYGWKHWASVIGLRADESRRVVKAVGKQRDRWHNVCPLFDAKIEEIDVLRFWRSQSFDLNLAGKWEGNCDGCFLKNRGGISRMFKDHPERMQWWVQMEAAKQGVGTGGTFRVDREPYAEIARRTRDQGVMNFDIKDSIPCDEAWCGA